MALVSSKGVYALAAMYVLARHAEKQALSTEAIAKEANIPKNYLEQILIALKRGGLVSSKRGAHGGYILARPAEKITILQIIKAAESTCCEELCRTDIPALRAFWHSIEEAIEELLKKPLSSLVQKPIDFVI